MAPCYPLFSSLRRIQTGTLLSLPTPTPSALDKLQTQPLDVYLKRLMPQVDGYFNKLHKNTALNITPQFIKVEIIFENRLSASDSPSPSASPTPGQVVQDALGVHAQIPERQLRFRATENVTEAVICLDFVILLNNLLLEHANHVLASVEDVKEKTLKRLRQLKASVIHFTKYLDVILLYYTHHIGKLPEFETVNESKAAILKVINQINPEDLKKIIPPKVEATEEHILCAAVGLNWTIADELRNLDAKFRMHQPDEYFLRYFVTRNIQPCGLNADTDKLLETLTNAGFSSSRANVLIELIETNKLSKQQDLEYWVEWYFRHSFQYDVFFSHNCPRYPFNEEVVNEWKEIEFGDDDGDEGSSTIKVAIYNTTIASVNSVFSNLLVSPEDAENKTLWYHGCQHKDAKSILENGIQLRKGNPKQDFSDEDGFYCTPDHEYAIDWAKGKGKKTAAVIIFDVTGLNFMGMDLYERKADWTDVVKYNRCGRDKTIFRIHRELKLEFNSCDCVLGPMSGDGTKCTGPSWTPSHFSRGKRQVCVRSDDLASALRNRIFRTIFISG